LKAIRRYFLRGRKNKQLLEKLLKNFKIDISNVNKRIKLEVMEISVGNIILIDGKASFIQFKDQIFPTLLNENVLTKLPSIKVDMGAVPHICNGADLMAPGLVEINGVFDSGEIIVILEERFLKMIAIGKSLYSSNEIAKKKYGKIAFNLHFVGDVFWDSFKLIKN
jgi:PUA domain protein